MDHTLPVQVFVAGWGRRVGSRRYADGRGILPLPLPLPLSSSPDRGAELCHHSVHCRLRQAALPLQQLLAVAAADELEAQRDLVAADVEALVAHDVRVLADPEEHR